MLILSHRGRAGGNGLPDNTLEAFDAALRSGRDGIEFDVRGTSDGAAVLWHDRLAPDGRPVASLSRADLSRLAGFDVPVLGDALRRLAGAFLDVELKDRRALDAARATLRDLADPSRTLVTSFRHDLVAAAADGTGLPCGVIVGHRSLDAAPPPWRGFEDRPLVRSAVWDLEMLDPAVVERASADGFRTLAWGIGTSADLDAARALGLFAAISDV